MLAAMLRHPARGDLPQVDMHASVWQLAWLVD